MSTETTQAGVSSSDAFMSALDKHLGAEDAPGHDGGTAPVQAPAPATESELAPAADDGDGGSDDGAPEGLTVSELLEKTGLTREQFDALRDRIKIDGEEHELTIAQLRKINGLEGHVNKKSIEVSERLKAVQEQSQKLDRDYTERLQLAAAVIGRDEASITQQYQALQAEYQTQPWMQLRAQDPGQAAASELEYRRAFEMLQSQYAGTQQAKQMMAQQYQAAQQQRVQEAKPKALEAIQKAHPEYADEAAYRSAVAEMKAYLKDKGTPESNMDVLELDPVVFSIVRDAAAYRKATAARAQVRQQVQSAPPMRSGARGQTNPQQSAIRQARERLAKSGRPDDFERLIEQTL